jgi:hypothetical protein
MELIVLRFAIMFSGLVVTLLMTGAPVPEVTNAETVKQHMGASVAVVGQLERVAIWKGKSEWQGTALVLDDDTIVYVSYAAPPAGWEAFIGVRVRVEGLLRPSLNDHEQSLMAPHLREPRTPKKEDRTISKLVGTRVRLSGIARDAKGGAVLLINDSPLYLAGLESWPSAVQGKQVAVGGKLVDKQYLPQATRNAKGEVSQGAEGSQLVLEAPAWRLIQEPQK